MTARAELIAATQAFLDATVPHLEVPAERVIAITATARGVTVRWADHSGKAMEGHSRMIGDDRMPEPARYLATFELAHGQLRCTCGARSSGVHAAPEQCPGERTPLEREHDAEEDGWRSSWRR